MKKLTIYSLHLGYGGIENAIRSLANNICSDYDVEIVSVYKLYDKEVEKINKKIKVTYLIKDDIALRVDKYKKDIKSLNIIKLFKDLFKEYKINIFRLIKDTFVSIVTVIKKRKLIIDNMRKTDSDIVISTRLEFNNYLSKYVKNKSYKIAWEQNHHHNNMEYVKKVVDSCRNIDTLVLVSDSLRNFYKKKMKDANYKCKCVFIPNILNDIPDRVSKLDENNFISIGKFSKEKGFVDLVEVINLFKERNPKVKFHLDIIGDGSERNKIVDKVYEYNLLDEVKVQTKLSEDKINKLLENSSIYLMTSFNEPFGMNLVEVMSYGIPCLAFSSAEAANDLIVNDNNGYLVDGRDKEEMVKKIELLISNKKKRIELGENARNYSLKYNIDNVKQEWHNLLKRKD